MNRKELERLRKERDIPENVLQDLRHHRERILSHEVKQEEPILHYKKRVVLAVAMVAAILLILVAYPQINTAIKNMLGISQDAGVAVVESSGIENELNLVSESNGKQITLTKFVATKKKLAFDYQFKIEDDQLMALLQKDLAAGSNMQFIDLGLFANGQTENLFGGVSSGSTFRVEGDMFYGSVVAVFTKEKIPENAQLTLHIYKLSWQDREAYEAALAEALAATPQAESFQVGTALEYEGDWSFAIDYLPLTESSVPQVIETSNITDIEVISDALQTTATFVAPLRADSSPSVTIYKDDVKIENFIEMEIFNPTTGKMDISFGLSALDKSSAVYTIQVNEADPMNGQPLYEIGSFKLRNE